MAEHKKADANPRRSFLKQAAGLAAATSLLPTAVPAESPGAASAASTPYQSLGPDEASFIEARSM